MAFATVQSWSETPASNTEIDGVNIDEGCNPSGINNAIRELMAQVAAWTGDDTIASATTTDLSTVNGQYVTISGTTTITGFGTVKAGWVKFLKFDGALTLTHNATSLILPGAANKTTAAGDTAVFVSLGSGNWRMIAYQDAAGFYANVGVANTWTATQTFANIITSANIVKSTNASNVVLSGGDTASNGANLELYGGTHATQANNAFLDADTITLRSQAGVARATLDSSTLTLTLPVRLPAGSAAAPSIATTDVDTGLYSVADGTLGITANGAVVGYYNTTGLTAATTTSAATFGSVAAVKNLSSGQIDVTRDGGTAIRASRFTNDGAVISIHSGATLVGSISISGSTTAYNTSSDGRLKENLGDFDAGSIIDAIKVYEYNWIADGTIGYGPVAQELHTVFPIAVTVGSDEEPWTYDPSKLVPVLIREIQSLRARLDNAGL